MKADITVIGGGFTGLSTAYNLQMEEPGLFVEVLEVEIVGLEASGWKGGNSITVFGLELNGVKTLLRHQ